MGRYGEVATRAVGLLLWEPGTSPREAWVGAAGRVFSDSRSSQAKGCPKSTFLGLCEEGVVAGVHPGQYTSSTLNKGYGVRALRALRADPTLVVDAAELWRVATDGREVRPNSQMDVVSSLWSARLLR